MMGFFTRRAGRQGMARRPAKGFTLIELMIVVAVVAILAAVAYASYSFATIKARRSAAQACLMENAQRMERYYTTNLSYTGAPAPSGACTTELTGFYTFDFDGVPEARSFVVQAQPTDRQKDTRCGTMSINQLGVRTPNTDGCW